MDFRPIICSIYQISPKCRGVTTDSLYNIMKKYVLNSISIGRYAIYPGMNTYWEGLYVRYIFMDAGCGETFM